MEMPCRISSKCLLILDTGKAIDNSRYFDFGDITNEIDFFPLDNKGEESLVGEIQTIKESERRLYIYDNPSGPVKVFDKEGKFISTIGRTGRGPDEYVTLYGMTVDYLKDNIYAFVAPPRGVVAYDVTGRIFARTEALTNGEIEFYGSELIMFDIHIIMPDFDEPIKTPFEVFSHDLNYKGSISAFDEGSGDVTVGAENIGFINYTLSAHILSSNGKSLFVKQGRNDTVYHYRGDLSLEPAFVFNFGNHTPPSQVFGLNPTQTWSNNYYGVQNIYVASRYILVEVQNSFIGDRDVLIFDRQESSDGFMATGGPDGRSGLFIDGIRLTPCYIRDNRLVGYIQAFDIVDNATTITNPDLKALAAILKEDSNPVIVIATLKK